MTRVSRGNVWAASLYHGVESATLGGGWEIELLDAHGIEAAVDRGLCVGSGPCFVIAPRAFALDDTMKAVVIDTAAESEESLMAAAEECPTQAIYLSRDGAPLYP